MERREEQLTARQKFYEWEYNATPFYKMYTFLEKLDDPTDMYILAKLLNLDNWDGVQRLSYGSSYFRCDSCIFHLSKNTVVRHLNNLKKLHYIETKVKQDKYHIKARWVRINFDKILELKNSIIEQL